MAKQFVKLMNEVETLIAMADEWDKADEEGTEIDVFDFAYYSKEIIDRIKVIVEKGVLI